MDIGVTVGDSFERLEATGTDFDFVEFGLSEGVDPETDIDDDRLREALEATTTNLCVHLPFKQVAVTPVPEINDAIVAHQTRLLEWAGGVGAEKAVLHGTARNPHETDIRPAFAEQVCAIGEAGEAAGVEVVLENVGHQKRGFPQSVLGDIARDTDTAVCFDVGHAYMEGGNDGVERFLREYADLVSHLHVHDARSRGDTHIPIGAGEIDYSLLEDRLEGFDGTVAVEVFTDDAALLTDTAGRVASALDATFGGNAEIAGENAS